MPDSRTHTPPGYLLPVLVALIVIGLTSVGLTLAVERQQRVARVEDVAETTALVETLTNASEARNQTGREAHHAICVNVEAVARELGLDPNPCPDLREDPANGHLP